MTEILTELFCERCGTRYTFESARPRTRLKGVRVLSRGLKNFVMSDGTSMDEAMASARNETDRELTNHQLDAFHATFNFCMTCRQYTCPNCWNEVEARCLTCAPHLGHDVMPAPFPDLATNGLLVADPLAADGFNGSNGTGHGFAMADAAPIASDDDGEGIDFAARLAALTATRVVVDAVTPVEPEAQVVAPVEAVTEVEPVAEVPVVVAEVPVEPVAEVPVEAVAEAPVEAVAEPIAVVEAAPQVDDHREDIERATTLAAAALTLEAASTDEPAPSMSVEQKTAAQTGGLLQRFRPGQSLDAEIDAYEHAADPALSEADRPDAVDATQAEPEIVAAEPEVVAEPDIAAAVVAAEPEAAVEPEVVAEAVVAAEPEPETPAEPEPAVVDVVPQPTWRMIAPDTTPEPSGGPIVDPGLAIPAAAAADPRAEPQWPDRPEWLGQAPASGLPFLGRPATPQGGLEALWAESTVEVVAPLTRGPAPAAVQPCVSCGLSLSSTARFCRRCGTSQPR